jgi:hypothetical protein
MFRETNTVDEMGIGAVRDSIADQLFPGTSVIQTRLRYALMVPWLFIEMEKRLETAAKFASVARAMELELGRILADIDTPGVFGRSAGDSLKRLASSVYWAGLGSWGIRVFRGTQQQYFRQIESIYATRARRNRQDDGDWLDPHRAMTWHPALVKLMPEGFPEGASLELTRDEALFIREQWKKTHPDSLLTWLSFDEQSEKVQADTPWLHARQADFPLAMQSLVEHGRLFSTLTHGASLVYNLHLSEVDARADGVEEYRASLAEWSSKIPASGLIQWNLDSFWLQVAGKGHSVTPKTRRFVETWLRIVRATDGDVVDSSEAKALIERREQDMKGDRSRFTNPAARKIWGGASGLTELSYRWGITSNFLADLRAGLEST